MSTQGWIKMSEHPPTEVDAPVWMSNGPLIELWQKRDFREYFIDPKQCEWLHWQPATLPEPPAKELTQRELDEEALREWNRREYRGSQVEELVTHCESRAWHAAIAYRDKQNAEDVANLGLYCSSFDTTAHSIAVKSLRRRCGLDQ